MYTGLVPTGNDARYTSLISSNSTLVLYKGLVDIESKLALICSANCLKFI